MTLGIDPSLLGSQVHYMDYATCIHLYRQKWKWYYKNQTIFPLN